MNQGLDGKPADGPGEEFIDPDFQPKLWPQGLKRAMVQLLGSKPDRLYSNYRMQQVMQMLHSTELEEYVYTLNNRVTYLPISSTQFFDEVFGQLQEQYAGNPIELVIDGFHKADEGVGITTLQWSLTVLNASQIRVNRLAPNALLDNVVNYTSSHGLSDYIELPGSDLVFKFPTDLADGAEWIVTSKARPEQDIGLRLTKLISVTDDETQTAVFQPRNEPILTLQNSFRDNDLLPYKAGGLLLAFALYMNTLPQEQ